MNQAWLDEWINSRQNFLPIKQPRDVENEIFVWEFKGHDPRNHHGRFMHPEPVGFTVSQMIIINDTYLDDYDPQNYIGKNL